MLIQSNEAKAEAKAADWFRGADPGETILPISIVPAEDADAICVGDISSPVVPSEDFSADLDGGLDVDFSAQMTLSPQHMNKSREGNVAPIADESWEAGSFLPPAEPAPALASRGAAICTRVDLVQLVAPVVILLCLREGRESFATRAIWDLVPEPKPRYRRLTAVGDVLGKGAGKASLGLYRGHTGDFVCCRENVCLAAYRMTPDELQALALRLGYAIRGDFEAAIAELPAATAGTPM